MFVSNIIKNKLKFNLYFFRSEKKSIAEEVHSLSKLSSETLSKEIEIISEIHILNFYKRFLSIEKKKRFF
jgi:hypothetical protein